MASASRGSSRLLVGSGAGDMVRDRPASRAVRTPPRGPSPGVAPPLPRAPLSSGGTEFGFLERCPLGDEAIVLERAYLLVPSSPFFDLSSCLVGELDREPSVALSSGPSLLPQPLLRPRPQCPPFPVRTWLFQPESNYSQEEPGKKKRKKKPKLTFCGGGCHRG